MSHPIISADSRITEPPNTYVDYIDPAWRERAPRLERQEPAGDVFVVDGLKRPIPLGTVAAAGKPAEEIRTEERREAIVCRNAAKLFRIALAGLVR